MKRLILVTALGLATSTFPALAGPGDAFRNTVVNWTNRAETVLRDARPPATRVYNSDKCTEGARGLTARGSANCDYDTSGSQVDPEHKGMIAKGDNSRGGSR